MEPDELINGISQEIAAALKNMSSARTPEEKLMYSEIVKNLGETLGVFFSLISEAAMYDDDEPNPF